MRGKIFDKQIRLAVIRDVVFGKQLQCDVSRKYKIPNNTVSTWVKNYNEGKYNHEFAVAVPAKHKVVKSKAVKSKAIESKEPIGLTKKYEIDTTVFAPGKTVLLTDIKAGKQFVAIVIASARWNVEIAYYSLEACRFVHRNIAVEKLVPTTNSKARYALAPAEVKKAA